MLLKTILNRVQHFKSFVYGKIQLVEASGKMTLEVEVLTRKKERRFEFVPLWGIVVYFVYFVYAMRLVACPHCGVIVEQVPWARGKSRLTIAYRWFLAR